MITEPIIMATGYNYMATLETLLDAVIGSKFNSYYFGEIRDFVLTSFNVKGLSAMERLLKMVTVLASTWLAIKFIWMGYEATLGQSRIADILTKVMKVGTIMLFATSASFSGQNMYNHIMDLQDWIASSISGQYGPSLYSTVDHALGQMQLLLRIVQSIETQASSEAIAGKSTSMILLMGGSAGPAVIGGTMLLLNQITIVLLVTFSPIFIMALAFEQTRSMFWTWLKYVIASSVSFGILIVCVEVASDAIIRFAQAASINLVAAEIANLAASINPNMLRSDYGTSVMDMAMQQCGLGIIMTALLLYVPQTVGNLFGGALVNSFAANNTFSTFARVNTAENNAQTISKAQQDIAQARTGHDGHGLGSGKSNHEKTYNSGEFNYSTPNHHPSLGLNRHNPQDRIKKPHEKRHF